MIHPSAIIGNNVQVDPSSQIGPYTIIEDNVTIGPNCIIRPHSLICQYTTLENNVFIDCFASIGGAPQDKNHNPSHVSFTHIGSHTIIREGVTISRPTQPNQTTKIGSHCMLMANSHVAHDCIIGNNVTLTNGVLLGGYVQVDDFSNLGGNAVVHQHIHIGQGCMIAGRSAINLDIPPFIMLSEHNRIHGLNTIGLRRRNFSQENISSLKRAFHFIFDSIGNPYLKAQEAINLNLNSSQLAHTFLSFFQTKGPKGCVQGAHAVYNKKTLTHHILD